MILKFTAKCSDMSSSKLFDADGNLKIEHDGYVPSDLGIGGGDYIKFELDLSTGKLIGFIPVSDTDAMVSLGAESEEEEEEENDEDFRWREL